ncbi:hypothetical protein CC79DRAFT_1338006 [Sarocladium strictum]
MPSFVQTSLAAAMGLSCAGTFVGLRSPNKNPSVAPRSGDVAGNPIPFALFTIFSKVPTAIGLYTTYLALRWPVSDSPGSNFSRLNPDLFTWSPSTILPIAALLGIGIPLRLISYSSLGKNFTFKLQAPDELVTTGIYKYVQHPSYTGLTIVTITNAFLFLRPDGVVGLLMPTRGRDVFMWLWSVALTGLVSLSTFMLGKRVQEEERLLKSTFGKDWVEWHSRTARFIPWLW